ncbi:MAG TPA: hypothetical protein VFC85_07225 [Verrucomicrobiae bacterium]|nr:hypothetical protein [Verrucomicrobiae bacterium]
MASDSGDDGIHDEVKTATIRTFSSHEAAQLAASNLEAHGIKCWVNADDCGGMYPNLTAAGGVRLSVHAADAEAAIALLNAEASPAEINQIEAEAVASAPPATGQLKKPAWIHILFGIVTGIILYLLYQQIKQSGTKYFYNYTSDDKCYEAFTYENGHLFETVKDRNLDGKWDAWIYYQNGHVIRAEYDNNFDGKLDEWITYSNASTMTAEKDSDFNGIPDEFVTYINGMIQQMEIKPNGSTFATQRWIYKNDVLVEILRGGDSDGNFTEDVQYDPFLNPISTNIPAPFQSSSPK